MTTKTLYRCDYCGEQFCCEDDCREHEKSHDRNYSNEPNKEISLTLRNIADSAWDWHIGNAVLGIPYHSFVSLLNTAAQRLTESEDGVC